MAKINGFEGDYAGLTQDEVVASQLKNGKNELVPEKKKTLLSRILSVFKEPMLALLFGTALIYFFLGDYRDGIIMMFFVVVVTSISFFQEWRTDRTLDALKDLSSPKVTVIRNNELITISSSELTVGDVMLLKEGDKVPADGQIVEMHDLGMDESALTGESEVSWKRTTVEAGDEAEYWKKNYCYAGTAVINGLAIVQVTATGLHTEYGKVGVDVSSAPEQPTPLETQTRRLIKSTFYVSIGLFVLVLVVTFLYYQNFINGLLSAITVTMAMIPEEFPVVLTVFLAMGAWRLAKKNALIRRMPAIETLGAISVLCVDKTGTLTKNQMEVRDVYDFHDRQDADGRDVIRWAVLACESQSYDPMEKAILERGKENGVDVEAAFSHKFIFEYPFSSESKMMGHVWELEGKAVLVAKGSPESILPLCQLNAEDVKAIEARQFAMASKGYRVIAVAKNEDMSTIPESLNENRLELLGLIGLADPPREVVPHAIDVCNKAGIRVVMITGDNGVTAQAIAREVGIRDYEHVITGQELEAMSDEELARRIANTNIFARVIPRHKMRIVKAFKDAGEVVAMTGDGVNDAPALKYADIGVAMGKRGTGVAKEAASMILLDDNFTTIVESIRNGRRIYDNIKKSFEYVLSVHVPIALTAVLAPLLHLPLLLLPTHVVMLELIIDPTCSIVFEHQPEEPDIMDRKPRPRSEPLITTKWLTRAMAQGGAIFAAAFAPYVYMMQNGFTESFARSFSLATLILADVLLVHVNRSNVDSMFKGMFTSVDRVTAYINTGVVLGLLAILYIPALNVIASTSPLPLPYLAGALGVALLSTLWWELVKVYMRSKRGKRTSVLSGRPTEF